MSMATDILLYDCENFLLLNKPHGMPTVPLKTQPLRGTLLEQAGMMCPAVLKVKGKNSWEGGALHRLDTATAGIVLFAKNQSFYEQMLTLQNNNLFEKYYIAKTFENDSLKGFDIENFLGIVTISSYFKPFGPKGKEVRAILDEKKANPKILYQTEVLREKDIFYCTITKGFRHQIRAHLAWTGHPIIGDSLYGSCGSSCGGSCGGSCGSSCGGSCRQSQDNEILHLECVGISFPIREKGEEKRYLFKKKSAEAYTFPSLCRFANSTGNVII